MEQTERATYRTRYSTLGDEKIAYHEYMKPHKCPHVEKDGTPCKKSEIFMYPHNGKDYCFFCWSILKYYSDDNGFEKGGQTIIGKKVVKKNAFYSKAEQMFKEKKIEELEWNDFKTLYVADKKKARRYIKKVFRNRGL